eukprot:TRINITY_DN6227_c0_g1_i1.p1 TRINITY_DN6227_c0_g1~~TRINITY_DN6227_c0_g1_i1.p1  ORF type:complete len:341 (-),score=81.41 TRINITY_DN6227_c0_g1_i1:9-1031(-)
MLLNTPIKSISLYQIQHQKTFRNRYQKRSVSRNGFHAQKKCYFIRTDNKNIRQWKDITTLSYSSLKESQSALFKLSRRFYSEGDKEEDSKQGDQGKEKRQRRGGRGYQQSDGRNKKMGFYLLCIFIGGVALSYLAVPIYRAFCRATGYGGTVQTNQNSELKTYKIDRRRDITVHFTGDVNTGLPWKFRPLQSSIDVYAGEAALVFYEVHNESDVPIIGIATYNVLPYSAGLYFEKIECFCFDEQLVGPNETVEMPILFRIDPDFFKSKFHKETNDITLSYTFFLSSDQDLLDEDGNPLFPDYDEELYRFNSRENFVERKVIKQKQLDKNPQTDTEQHAEA